MRRALITKVTLPPGERRPSAFARGPDERPLRIVLDAETATGGAAVELLEDIAHHPLIEVASMSPRDGMLTLAFDPQGKRERVRYRCGSRGPEAGHGFKPPCWPAVGSMPSSRRLPIRSRLAGRSSSRKQLEGFMPT